MQAVAQVGLLISCVIAGYVGIRTLLIWRHTRMIQELCIGINILAIATGGLTLTLIRALGDPNEAAPTAALALGLFGLVAHVAALWIGTWKIFRPAARWAMPVVAIAIALSCLWMVQSMLHNGEGQSAARSMLLLALRGTGMVWAAYECFRYSAMLRKRVALGLAEPLMAHRIWLWGVGAAATLVVISLDFASWLLLGSALGTSAAGLHVTSLLGLLATASIALAFFPPAAYVEMIERRQAPATART